MAATLHDECTVKSKKRIGSFIESTFADDSRYANFIKLVKAYADVWMGRACVGNSEYPHECEMCSLLIDLTRDGDVTRKLQRYAMLKQFAQTMPLTTHGTAMVMYYAMVALSVEPRVILKVSPLSIFIHLQLGLCGGDSAVTRECDKVVSEMCDTLTFVEVLDVFYDVENLDVIVKTDTLGKGASEEAGDRSPENREMQGRCKAKSYVEDIETALRQARADDVKTCATHARKMAYSRVVKQLKKFLDISSDICGNRKKKSLVDVACVYADRGSYEVVKNHDCLESDVRPYVSADWIEGELGENILSFHESDSYMLTQPIVRENFTARKTMKEVDECAFGDIMFLHATEGGVEHKTFISTEKRQAALANVNANLHKAISVMRNVFHFYDIVASQDGVGFDIINSLFDNSCIWCCASMIPLVRGVMLDYLNMGEARMPSFTRLVSRSPATSIPYILKPIHSRALHDVMAEWKRKYPFMVETDEFSLTRGHRRDGFDDFYSSLRAHYMVGASELCVCNAKRMSVDSDTHMERHITCLFPLVGAILEYLEDKSKMIDRAVPPSSVKTYRNIVKYHRS